MSEPTTPATPTATTATPTAPANTAPEADTQGNPDEAGLGDAGKQALDRMKAERNAAKQETAALQAQIDKINRANESAVEKAQREATEAKESAIKATADALRFRVAAKHSISEEDADLFLTGTDAETLERQAARLAERAPVTSAGPRPDLSQGGKGKPATGSPEQDFANFLGAQMGSGG